MKLLRTLVLGLCALAITAHADERMKPFVLAYKAKGEVAAVAKQVKAKLAAAGLKVVGEYSPYADADIVVVTDAAMQQTAAKTEFGAYGAAQRVSITKVGGEIQVAYTNPPYMAAAYRMDGDLAEAKQKLAKALGAGEEFGTDDGLTAKKLRKYHYKIFMPYFDDQDKLASYDSHKEAVAAVEKGLAAHAGGTTKIYRIDIPGKEATLFGVGLSQANGADKDADDKYIMSEIDFKPLRSTAHLPYDMVVIGGKVYALSAKFRIAINFPDLSMMGSNSFMNIMGAPGAIHTSLAKAAGGS